jgi:hypothetical protein
MSVASELFHDLGILTQIIAAVEAAQSAQPGQVIATIKGVHVAGKKLTITLTEE